MMASQLPTERHTVRAKVCSCGSMARLESKDGSLRRRVACDCGICGAWSHYDDNAIIGWNAMQSAMERK